MSKRYELGLNELDSLVNELPNSGIIALRGNLASGKTTLSKAIINNQNIVTSPTFSIMQEYDGIYHYDIYQGGFEAIKQNGLYENLYEDGLHIIEWADDKLLEFASKNGLNVCIIDIEICDNKRVYKVSYA